MRRRNGEDRSEGEIAKTEPPDDGKAET